MYAHCVFILSYWICNQVLLVQGKTISIVVEDEDSRDVLRLIAPFSPAQGEVTEASKPQPRGNQLNLPPNPDIAERIFDLRLSEPISVKEVFHSLLPLILGKLKKSGGPLQYDEINSDAHYLFREMKETHYVEDKSETIKKITDYLRQSRLYAGQFENTTTFETRFEKIKTTPNGDCFYNAISLLFFGHENFARGLRAITAAHMAINEALFVRLIGIFYETDLTWLSVLDHKKFAESVEIMFLSNILCRHIKIYESGCRGWYQYPLIECESPSEPLHLLLHQQHFSALRLKPNHSSIEAETFQLADLPPLKNV